MQESLYFKCLRKERERTTRHRVPGHRGELCGYMEEVVGKMYRPRDKNKHKTNKTFVNHLFDNDMFVINSGIVYVCAVCLPLGQPCLSVKTEDIIMVTFLDLLSKNWLQN